MLIRKQGLWCQGPIITSSKTWMKMRQCSWIFYWVLSFSFNFLFPALRFFSSRTLIFHCFFLVFISFCLFFSCRDVSEDIQSSDTVRPPSSYPRGNKCSQIIFKSSMSQRLLEFHTMPQKDNNFTRELPQWNIGSIFFFLFFISASFFTSTVGEDWPAPK